MRCAFLLTIDSSDNRGDVVKTIRGSGSILDLVEGRDPEITDPTAFSQYVLNTSLLPQGTPDIPCVAFVGMNQNVPAVVRNEYSSNIALWREAEFGGYAVPPTRDWMKQYLRQWAALEGITHIWEIIPGDVLTGDLLSHFVPIY